MASTVGEFDMRHGINWRCALLILLACQATASAKDYAGADIGNDRDGKNWLAYGRTYSEQHASPLKQIDAGNAARLGLLWSLDLPGVHNGATVPLAVDGVIYFTVDQSWVHAVDALSGKLLWRFDPEVYKVAGKKFRLSWGPRGIAYWRGKIYVGTLDGRLIALDAKSGKQLWSQQTVPADDSSNITGAPRVFNGKVIIGHGGADFGPIRGYVTAYDAGSGKQLWRFYAVPGNPADGFENQAMDMAAKTWTGEWWKLGGGGTIWNAITYDPDFNRVYLGTGNGQPHEWKERSPGGGDNLFLCSVVALNADTGEYVWHYQTNPQNAWDYNSNMDITLATLAIAGKPRKVLMHAPKNGFLYVIDRQDGKLISAEKIDRVTWAERIDLATGRPVENPKVRDGNGEVWPGAAGAHSVMAWAFNPDTKLLYIPVIRTGSAGRDRVTDDAPDRNTSRLSAWNPATQKEVWQVPTPGMWPGGVLTTAGNLVFQGQADGKFNAYEAATGKSLWSFDAKMGITGAPISYEANGKQYVTVVAGWGGTGAAFTGNLNARFGWQSRVHPHRVLTFALDGKAQLPPTPPPTLTVPIDDPKFVVDAERAKAGGALFGRSMCVGCHGGGAVAGGYAPDLRASPIALSAEAFKQVVKAGSLESRGMPKYDELSDSDLESLRHYLRDRARTALAAQPPAEPDAGQHTFDGSCARCHGFDGFGGVGPSLQRSEVTKPGNEAAFQAIVQNGIPARGMPAATGLTPTDLQALTAYVHRLRGADSSAWSASAARGQAIYARQDCNTCHVLAGQGRSVGPDLTRIGIKRRSAQLHQDLTEPSAALPLAGGMFEYLPVRVVTAQGKDVSGTRINEDAFSIQLRDANGQLHTYKKSELTQLDKHYDQSLMPAYKLPATDMDDLVAYLSSLRGAP